MASDLHRTATTVYLCCVPTLEESTGAGRVGLAGANIQSFYIFARQLCVRKYNCILAILFNTIMKKRNILAVILLGAVTVSFFSTTILSCGSDKNTDNTLFSIDTSGMKQQYMLHESVAISVKNDKNESIDSVAYFVNDKRIGSVKGNDKFTLKFENQKMGDQNIKAVVYFDGVSSEAATKLQLVSDMEPTQLEYTIVNTYPHDMKAYTQGLEFYRDTLFESTGQYGKSSLRKTDYKTGKVYKKIDLEGRFFGEGMTVLNNKVYQLTWREETGFIYNADTFEKEKEFKYFSNIQGWGLTNDGRLLYQTDGTEKIWLIDPQTLKHVDFLNVYTKHSKIEALNELEWIDGKIWANVYQQDALAVIDPKTGIIEHIVNLSELKGKVTQHPELDVLNGIAYNPKTKTIFVTGKNWDKMFEIKIK